MASLQGNTIKDTYKSLLKVADNGELEAGLQQITDGDGNGTGVSLNTSGDVTATGTVAFGSIKDSGENITVTKFVDEADGIAANDNDTSIPTSAAVKDYVDSNVTAQDLDITDGTNNGSVDLDSQSLTFTGDAGVSATVSGQTVTFNSSALQSQITNNDTDITNLQTADATLQSNIDAEEAARIAADSALQTQITNNDTDITALQAADTTLQNNIDAEEAARIAADTTLQTNITAEATTRANADTTLQGNIDTEEAARIAADTTLQTNITTEASTRASADTALQGQITSNDGDISGLDTRLTAAESNITSNDSDISALDGRLTTAEGNITSNDTDISNLDSRLTTAEGNITSNDSDISALQSGKQDVSEKNQANGYAPLDAGAKVPIANLPDSVVGQVEFQGTWNASTDTPTLPAASGVKGHYYVVSTGGTYETITYAIGDWIISNGTAWEKVDNTDAVTTVFGRLGAIVANESDYSAYYPLISDLNTTNSNVSGLDTRLTTAEGDITAIETKTDFITVTQTVNLDTIESDTAANTSKLAGIEAGAQVNVVDSVNSQTGVVVLDADDIDDTSTTHKFTSQTDIDKLAGIEALADVTDATNVAAAGALMSGTAVLSDLVGVSSTAPADGQVLTFDTVNGWQPEDSQGEEYTISEISTNTNAQVGFLYVLTANLTLTLPASPSVGDKVALSNMSGTTTPTVARNGNLIAGLAEDLTIDVLNLSVEFIYSGASQGWIIFVDSILGTSGGGGSVDGNGTTNYISKWSDANTLTDSLIQDDGSTVSVGGNLAVDTNTLFVDAANNFVGIGTNSPSYKLTINTSDEDHLRLENGSELGFIRVLDSGIFDFWSHGDTNNEITFRNGSGSGTERMRIDSSGNMLIGDSTYAGFGQLQIGNASTTTTRLQMISSPTTGSGGIHFGDTTSANNGRFAGFLLYDHNGDFMRLGTAEAERMRITSAGAIHLSQGTGNAYVGTDAGNLGTSTGSYNTAFGDISLYSNTTGNFNSANGVEALQNNTIGSFNIANGFRALLSNTTGNNNIAIGYNAGNALTTGSNNTIIGNVSGTAGMADTVIIAAGTTERLRIDSSGNVLIGTTSFPSGSTTGFGFQGASKYAYFARSGGEPLNLDRHTSDGDVLVFRKDGSEVGSIEVSSAGASIYLGGTAAANALDDYEEGTWTPSTATAGYTISASGGTYTKIGRQVTIRGHFQFSAVNAGSTSNVLIAGLPFISPIATPGSIRENTTTGTLYAVTTQAGLSTLYCNSMDSILSGSNRPFFINENYELSLTYFV
jgi:hypothetical protein